MRRNDVLPQLGKGTRQIRFNVPKESKTLFGEDVSVRIASVKESREILEPLVVTQVHLIIIKVRRSYTPLTTVAHQLHTTQKT